MQPQQLFEDIRAYCIRHQDATTVARYSRYFKEGYDAYGLTQELVEQKSKAILAQPKVDLKLVLATSRLLIPTGKYEETSFAYLLTKAFIKEFDRSAFEAIEEWFKRGIINWAHADVMGGELLPHFIRKKIVSLSDFAAWRQASNKFQRRAVPVTLIKPFKEGYELSALLAFVEPLMLDQERVVHQGMGWFLRECWKKQPQPVEAFLHKWKNQAARLIFQYATEKMSKEYRQQFRKSKK